MSTRATWSSTQYVDVEVTDEFRDGHGTTIDEGCVAIVLGQDEDCFVIEGADLDSLRTFVSRLTEAVTDYALAHPNEGDECTCRNTGVLGPHDPECPIPGS